LDRINAQWQAVRAMANSGVPTAMQVMHQITRALSDVPGSVNQGGGNTGGGDTPNQIIDKVLAAAQAELHKPYKLGAEGPDRFDCSGLVDWCFRTTGEYPLIGSARKLAAGYAHWFASQGHYTHDLTQRQRGDLITYSHNGTDVSHIALYLGSDRIISALINPWGVSNTGWRHINVTPVGVCKVQYAGRTQAAFQADIAQGPTDAAEFSAILATDQDA
jgi:cell wall-associated NlpC family hydrolase